MVIHTSFGAYSHGHVTEISDARMTMQLIGLSDALGAQVYGGYVFDRRPDGYTVHGRARLRPDDGWTISGDSVWTRKAG